MNHLTAAARLARECELSLRMAMEAAEPLTAFFLTDPLNVLAPVAERLGTLAQISGEQEASEFKSVVCQKCGQKGLVFTGIESFVCHACNELQGISEVVKAANSTQDAQKRAEVAEAKLEAIKALLPFCDPNVVEDGYEFFHATQRILNS